MFARFGMAATPQATRSLRAAKLRGLNGRWHHPKSHGDDAWAATPERAARTIGCYYQRPSLKQMHSHEGPSVAAAFEHQVRSGASAGEIADAVAATWRHIDESLTPIIGPQGVTALYKRSLLLTSRSHAWLATLLAGAPNDFDVAAFTVALTQRESNDAALAGSELLETFYGLVNGLIGISLTHRLLRFMWQIFEDSAQGDSP